MTDQNENTTVAFELPTAVEITETNKYLFDVYADKLGVKVGKAGRKPKGALVKAIQASDVFTLVDTPYLNAAMADGDAGSTDYGRELKVLRDARNAAVTAAEAEFKAKRAELQAKHGMTAQGKPDAFAELGPKPAGDVRVSARTPQITKEGAVRLSNAGKVMFRPHPREVIVTPQEISATVGSHGRQSTSQAVQTAVIAGDWFPRELLADSEWATKFLKDVSVVRVTEDAASE
jgi:hypothetical protein